MDNSSDPNSPSYNQSTISPSSLPSSSRTPNLPPISAHPSRFPSLGAQFNLATSGVSAGVFTLPLYYLQSVPVHAWHGPNPSLHKINIANPFKLPGLRSFTKHYTPNWIVRQGLRVWTYGVLSHMMTYGSGAGDWRRGGEDGRSQGLATNPIVIAAMAGFGSGVVDALVEDSMTMGVMLLLPSKSNKEVEPGSAEKPGTSATAGKRSASVKSTKGRSNASNERTAGVKNKNKKVSNPRSTFPGAVHPKDPDILPYISKHKLEIDNAFLDFGTVQRLQWRVLGTRPESAIAEYHAELKSP